MFCEHCGKPMDAGGIFCGHCGKKNTSDGPGDTIPAAENAQAAWLTATEPDAPPSPEATGQPVIFCERCGSPLDIGSAFCGSCGNKSSASALDGDDMAAAAAQTLRSAAAEPDAPKVTGAFYRPAGHANALPPKGPVGSSTRTAEKVNRRNIIIAVTLAVLLLGGASVGLFLSGRGNDADMAPTDSANYPGVSAESIADENTNKPPAAAPTTTAIPEPTSEPTPEPTSEPTSEPTPEPTPEPVIFDMAELTAIIAQMTSESNVAVAVADLNTGDVYASDNADTQFVAAGFYAPVYLAYYESGTDNTSEMTSKVSSMMSTMDNQDANAVINHLGGLRRLNNILLENNYTKTEFNRSFGDVAASNRGMENYTSAKEAALLLWQLYVNGGYLEMNVNLASDGIELPGGASYYAHRGQGIGTSFNVFAIAITPTARYAVAVMTTETGSTSAAVKTNATTIISEVLANVQQQMEEISESG